MHNVSPRRQNPHTLKRVKFQQVRIAADDDVRLAVDSHFEELVVALVSAGAYRGWNEHKPHGSPVSFQKFKARSDRQESGKSGPAQNLVNLRQSGC